MPPTFAAATITASGFAECRYAAVSSWRSKSRRSWPIVRTSQSTSASRRTMAEPTMPRWPATKTRRPRRSNSGALAAVAVAGGSVAAAMALLLEPDRLEVGLDHVLHKLVERHAMPPAEQVVRLARIADQGLDFGRAEIARVDLDEHMAGFLIQSFLVGAGAFPDDAAADAGERFFDELAHRMRFACRQHKIVGLVLLHDPPHAFDIVAGMAPIALGVEIAEKQRRLQAELDGRHGAGDLAGHEGLAADRAFVVEQDAVRGVHAVGFAIVHGDPVGVEFCGGIGRARIKRRRFLLRRLLRLAVELRGRSLIEAGQLVPTQDPDGFQ